MIESSTKFFASAASLGQRMGSYSRIQTVQPLANPLLFFYSRSIHVKFVDSHRRCVLEVISAQNSPQMVKHWPSAEIRKESSPSTRSQFPVERNNVLLRTLHRSGGWRGLLTVAKYFSQMLVGFGKCLVEGASRKNCSLVKTDFSPRSEGTDWFMCISSSITTSGGDTLTHRLRPA